jgi:hypothetical protein
LYTICKWQKNRYDTQHMSAPLPASPSTLGSRSPYATCLYTVIWILHAPRVRVRCYMAECTRINYSLGLSTSSPSIYIFYLSIQCAANWPTSHVRLTTWTATLDLFPKQRGTMSDLKSLWTKIYNFRDDGPEHNPKSL